jgi:hypothetical protein
VGEGPSARIPEANTCSMRKHGSGIWSVWRTPYGPPACLRSSFHVTVISRPNVFPTIRRRPFFQRDAPLAMTKSSALRSREAQQRLAAHDLLVLRLGEDVALLRLADHNPPVTCHTLANHDSLNFLQVGAEVASSAQPSVEPASR